MNQPNPRGGEGPPLTEEELVALLWRLAPVGSKLSVMPLRTWVLHLGDGYVENRVLVANHRLPAHLLALADTDPEGFTRALGRLAYGDENAFTPE